MAFEISDHLVTAGLNAIYDGRKYIHYDGYWYTVTPTGITDTNIIRASDSDLDTWEIVSTDATRFGTYCSVDIYGSVLYIFYYGYTPSTGYYLRTYDIANDTWGSPEYIGSMNTGYPSYPAIYIQGTLAHMSWYDNTSGRCYRVKHLDTGILDAKETFKGWTARNASLIVAPDGNVFIAYEYYTTNYYVTVHRRTGVSTWVEDLPPIAGTHIGSAIPGISGGEIYFSYTRFISSVWQACVVKRSSAGAWGSEEQITTETFEKRIPDLALDDNGDLFCAYHRYGGPTIRAIYIRHKQDGVWGDPVLGHEVSPTLGDIYAIQSPWHGIASGCLFGFVAKETTGVTNSRLIAYQNTDPTISNISPSTGGVNKLVTINGSSFGAAISKSKVVFVNGTQEIWVPDDDITLWSDSQIKCYVPEYVNLLEAWDVKIYIVDNA